MGRDLVSSTVGAAIYSLALGIASVALPLLALEAGYSAAAVGVAMALPAAGLRRRATAPA